MKDLEAHRPKNLVSASLAARLVMSTCFAVVTGCAPSRGARPDAAVAPAVYARFDSLVAAIRRLDVERMLEFYDSDSTIVRAIDAQLLLGRAVVVRNFREGFAAVRSIDRLTFPERHLTVLGPEAAVLTVRLEEAYTDRAGTRTALRGTWTSIWQRQHGVWRIVQDAAVHVPVVDERPGRPPASGA